MRKYTGARMALIVALALTLAACSDDSSPDASGSQSPAPSATEPPSQPPSTPSPTPPATEPTTQPTTPAPQPEPTADPVCGDPGRWNTRPDVEEGPLSDKELFNVAIGSHADCDRLRFDVRTSGEVGYSVGYVDQLISDPVGAAITVPSEAILQVIIWAPSEDWKTEDVLYKRDWPALQSVTFAGSFENVTTFGVGVRGHERPFRAWTFEKDGVRSIVVDIAH